MRSALPSILIATTLLACTAKRHQDHSEADYTTVKLKEAPVSYPADSINMNGFVAWDDADSAKRPVVLIVHGWWGLNDYIKDRARQLAKLGYLAMAVDMYGNGETADNPEKAKQLSMPFYSNPQLAKKRFDAALDKIKTHPVADITRIAAIGYCFGGGMVLNLARLGENLKGVVSFHGSLLGVPPDKNLLKAQVLVCHGDSDKFVSNEEVMQFSHQMDSIGAGYSVIRYPNATHAFTNPASTENGKKFGLPIAYNAAADSASFNDMMSFFDKIFR